MLFASVTVWKALSVLYWASGSFGMTTVSKDISDHPTLATSGLEWLTAHTADDHTAATSMLDQFDSTVSESTLGNQTKTKSSDPPSTKASDSADTDATVSASTVFVFALVVVVAGVFYFFYRRGKARRAKDGETAHNVVTVGNIYETDTTSGKVKSEPLPYEKTGDQVEELYDKPVDTYEDLPDAYYMTLTEGTDGTGYRNPCNEANEKTLETSQAERCQLQEQHGGQYEALGDISVYLELKDTSTV